MSTTGGDRSLPLTDDWCCTDFKVASFSYKWIIRKLEVHCRNTSSVHRLQSPTFSSGLNDKWCLRLYPQCTFAYDTKLSLVLLEGAEKQVMMTTYELGILDKNQDKQKSYERQYISFSNGAESGAESFGPTHILLNKSTGLLQDGDLTIYCEGTIYFPNEAVHITGSRRIIQVGASECTQCSCSDLSQDFGSLLLQGTHSDVTLVVGEKEFKVHKSILSTRSPVFGKMFQHSMKESICNQVRIEDIDSDVIHEILTFIYTGKAPNIKKMTAALFYAADRYALDHLKTLCEEELCRNLKTQNVVDVLLLADRHNAAQLKAVCLDFSLAHAREITSTSAWSKLPQYPELLTEVIHKLTENPLLNLKPQLSDASVQCDN